MKALDAPSHDDRAGRARVPMRIVAIIVLSGSSSEEHQGEDARRTSPAFMRVALELRSDGRGEGEAHAHPLDRLLDLRCWSRSTWVLGGTPPPRRRRPRSVMKVVTDPTSGAGSRYGGKIVERLVPALGDVAPDRRARSRGGLVKTAEISRSGASWMRTSLKHIASRSSATSASSMNARAREQVALLVLGVLGGAEALEQGLVVAGSPLRATTPQDRARPGRRRGRRPRSGATASARTAWSRADRAEAPRRRCRASGAAARPRRRAAPSRGARSCGREDRADALARRGALLRGAAARST